MADPPVLWTPPDELVESCTMTRFMRWLETSAACGFDDLRGALAWSVDDLEAFWASIWDFFDVDGRRAPMRGARLARDAGRASGSRASRCPTPSTSSAARTTTSVAILFDARGGEAGASGPGASCASRPRASAAGLRAPRRAARRPRRRLHAEHPGDDRRVPGDGVARRGLVVLLAGLRRALASSTASRRSSRRCCSPSTATATAASDFDRSSVVARAAARDADARATTRAYLDGRAGTTTARSDGRARPSSACRSTTRCGSSTRAARPGLPKAIVHGHGGILLEHLKKLHLHLDARAGDRVFWFTTTGWMMWNFLVARAADAGRDRPLRRQPRPPGPGPAVGPRRGDAA